MYGERRDPRSSALLNVILVLRSINLMEKAKRKERPSSENKNQSSTPADKAIPIKCFVSHRLPSRESGSVSQSVKKKKRERVYRGSLSQRMDAKQDGLVMRALLLDNVFLLPSLVFRGTEWSLLYVHCGPIM